MKQNKQETSRREFITTASLVAAGLVLSPLLSFGKSTKNFFSNDEPLSGSFPKRKLRKLEVSALGLGCMTMAGMYNPVPSKEEMVKLIRSAYEKGITFFDTAELYGPYLSEEIVGEAVTPFRDKIVIASKLGWPGMPSSKLENMKKTVEEALKRLKTDRIDLYYLHRVSPNIPVEDVAGLMKELIKEGKINHFGLSEVDATTLRKAHAVQEVTALQSQYSLLERGPEMETLAACEELGIGFVPWSPLNRGFLTGKFDENTQWQKGDLRGSRPTFQKEVMKANMPLLDLIKLWAKKKEVTPAQFSLAWLMAQKSFIVPIPGTTNPAHFEENLGALKVKFAQKELDEFRTAFSKIKLIETETASGKA